MGRSVKLSQGVQGKILSDTFVTEALVTSIVSRRDERDFQTVTVTFGSGNNFLTPCSKKGQKKAQKVMFAGYIHKDFINRIIENWHIKFLVSYWFFIVTLLRRKIIILLFVNYV